MELITAVRANLTGLPQYEGGKRLNQKKTKQICPGASIDVLKRRLKRTPGNWRFHEAVKAVQFDAPNAAEQCQAVVDKYPTAPGELLLPPERNELLQRVKNLNEEALSTLHWCATLFLLANS